MRVFYRHIHSQNKKTAVIRSLPLTSQPVYKALLISLRPHKMLAMIFLILLTSAAAVRQTLAQSVKWISKSELVSHNRMTICGSKRTMKIKRTVSSGACDA